jgi:hypothetical protein
VVAAVVGNGTFRNSQGAPLSDRLLDGWTSVFGRVREAGAGRRTFKRGIFLKSVLRAESGQRPGLLEQSLRVPRQLVSGDLRGSFYSRDLNEPQPRDTDGVCGSKLGSVCARPVMSVVVTAG